MPIFPGYLGRTCLLSFLNTAEGTYTAVAYCRGGEEAVQAIFDAASKRTMASLLS